MRGGWWLALTRHRNSARVSEGQSGFTQRREDAKKGGRSDPALSWRMASLGLTASRWPAAGKDIDRAAVRDRGVLRPAQDEREGDASRLASRARAAMQVSALASLQAAWRFAAASAGRCGGGEACG